MFCHRRTLSTAFVTYNQGRNEVRWHPGHEASLAPPMFETELFRKKIYCIEESLWYCWDFLAPPRSHSAPHSDLAPGILRLLAPPRYAPAYNLWSELRKSGKKFIPIFNQKINGARYTWMNTVNVDGAGRNPSNKSKAEKLNDVLFRT